MIYTCYIDEKQKADEVGIVVVSNAVINPGTMMIWKLDELAAVKRVDKSHPCEECIWIYSWNDFKKVWEDVAVPFALSTMMSARRLIRLTCTTITGLSGKSFCFIQLCFGLLNKTEFNITPHKRLSLTHPGWRHTTWISTNGHEIIPIEHCNKNAWRKVNYTLRLLDKTHLNGPNK